MKLDEFAFLNQQLAGMLRAGIPLEGSLRELSSTMRRGRLRSELEALERELQSGVPFNEAIARRQLPDLYVRLTQAGVAGGDLPGVLTLLADYYSRIAGVMSRLRGLMVYPFIVLLGALGVSVLITIVYRHVLFEVYADTGVNMGNIEMQLIAMWVPSIILGCIAAFWLFIFYLPRWRNWLRWKLPGFREASLAQIAGAASLLLKSGAPLPQALELLRNLESRSPAGREMSRWLDLNRQGEGKWASFTAHSVVFPPLFIWLVAQGGEDMAAGFQRASEIYEARSLHKSEVLLYTALPMSILLLAGLIVGQLYPVLSAAKNFLNAIGL